MQIRPASVSYSMIQLKHRFRLPQIQKCVIQVLQAHFGPLKQV